jgi:hypothetical protein
VLLLLLLLLMVVGRLVAILLLLLLLITLNLHEHRRGPELHKGVDVGKALLELVNLVQKREVAVLRAAVYCLLTGRFALRGSSLKRMSRH